MSNLKDEVSGRIFKSIEDINETYGTNLKLPENLPDGCNILSYKIEGLYKVRLYDWYQENINGLFYHTKNGRWLDSGNITLEQEIADDIDNDYLDIIYLRLTQQEGDKPKFVPERLLGVLTDLGYVEEVGETYLNTEKYLWCGFDSVKYYISDDSDETVSFDEYIKLFYNTEDTL